MLFYLRCVFCLRYAFSFALCYFICVMLFCLRCAFYLRYAFLFELCLRCVFYLRCSFLFALCFLIALCCVVCVVLFYLRCAFPGYVLRFKIYVRTPALNRFVFLFFWWCVLFCLRFLFLFVLALLFELTEYHAVAFPRPGRN